MDTALYEVMRAANDRRNTVWAAAMTFSSWEPAEDCRTRITEAIAVAVAQGDAILAQSSWSGGHAVPIEKDMVELALQDENQWHPRRLPWARRLRLIATDQGLQNFESGKFDCQRSAPRRVCDRAGSLELQSLSCTELAGMAASVVAFLGGSAIGLVVGSGGVPVSYEDWSLGGLIGWLIGGASAMGLALTFWHRIAPAPLPSDLPENIVPDQYNAGPDLTGVDPFGDPRF